MPSVIRKVLGEHVPIVMDVREQAEDSRDGESYQPLGWTLTAITKPDGTNDVTNATLRYTRDGQGVYWWDTSSLSAGDYLVKGEALVANTGESVPVRRVYRLVEVL